MHILLEQDEIHTFLSVQSGLIGANWNKNSLLEKLNNSDFIELTGDFAKSLNHGLCVYNKGESQEKILFIETDMEKLEKLEREIEKKET